MIKFKKILKESVDIKWYSQFLDAIRNRDFKEWDDEDLKTIHPKYIDKSVQDILQSALKGNARSYLGDLFNIDAFDEFFEKMHEQIRIDHPEMVQGDRIVVYRGLFGPAEMDESLSQVAEVFWNLDVGDNVTLYASNRPYQGFTPDLDVATRFAKGAFDMSSKEHPATDAIAVVLKSTLDINSIMWYYDFLPHEAYDNPMIKEKEIIVDMSRAEDDSEIYDAWTCVDVRHADAAKDIGKGEIDRSLLGWQNVKDTSRSSLDSEIGAVLRDRLDEIDYWTDWGEDND